MGTYIRKTIYMAFNRLISKSDILNNKKFTYLFDD